MNRRSFLLGSSALIFLAATRHARTQQQQHTSLYLLQDGRPLQQENIDTPFDLASGTKSFAGTLAVLMGLPLDEPLSKVLTETEWKDNKTTLRQLLTLTSGLDPGKIGRPPTYADALKMPIGPAQFRYGPAPFQVFGEYLKRQTGTNNPLELYAKHLHIPTERWKIGKDGNPHLPSGAKLTAREWAAFGQFVLSNWEKLAPCFQGTPYNPCYGLSWWLNRACPPDLRVSTPPMNREIDDLFAFAEIPKDMVYAAGAGGQRLFLSPSKKLVVVRQIPLTLKGMRTRPSDAKLLKDVLTRIA